MKPRRIVALVAGALAALLAVGLLAAAGTLVWAHTTQRDAGGYYNTPTERLSTAGYAVTAQADFGASSADWVPTHFLGTVRIRAATATGAPVFIGIAPTADVDRWLAAVPHEHVTDLRYGPFRTFATPTRPIAGTQAPAPPGSQSFWVASAAGAGSQVLYWPSKGGDWTAVVMNFDASRGVAVDVTAGARTGVLLPVGLGVGGFGVLLLAGSALLIAFGLREPSAEGRPGAPAYPAGAAAAGYPAAAGDAAGVGLTRAPGTYPVRLDGHIDPGVSRWMWLVKWVLVIPHIVVLAFLWIAASVLVVVAGFAILFTGRYPRSIFEFNEGVMRWSWRVSFYAMASFATDRYPPFTLAHDPSYPADLTIEYPERLSRGLVLVKWWLLALPHYLIVAVFAGGWGLGWSNTASRLVVNFGLIGLLSLIAAVILAVGGRYPESVFDFVMGMNRWCYRVLAYSSLMRDEYPPFRLDTGGTDPGSVPAVPPTSPPAPTEPELIGTSRS